MSRPRSSPWRYGFLSAPASLPVPAAGPATPPGRAPRVIAVVSAKGGLGKTAVAVNLAAGLARHAPNEVVLLDADVQFGDVATALDLSPVHTLTDAVSPAAHDPMVLKTRLTPHSGGFFVVASASSPADGDQVTSDELGRLIEALSAIFAFVIIDTAPGLGIHSLAALDAATDAVFLCSLSVSSARSLRSELAVLAHIGLDSSRRHVVLNLADKAAGLTVRDAAATIGLAPDVVIARSALVALSMNRGIPLLHDAPASAPARSLGNLVARFTGTPAPARWRRRTVLA